MTRRHHTCPLWLELLEDRIVPTTFGNAWINPLHLTVSFAPEGTAVGPQSNQLESTLGQSFTTTQWETDLLQAIQTWADVANINVGLVADSGAAFGSSPTIEGNPGTGDIRFGAVPLSSSSEVAETYPFQPLIGSWSGAVLLNSNEAFGNGTNGTYDLATVALHEVGHALGLPDNTDVNSVMYENYVGTRTTLDTSDVAAIQALYGVRQQDAYDLAGSNNSASQATVLSLGSSRSPQAIAVQADITTATDVDYYRITAPLSGLTTIELDTAHISLFTGALTVYNSNMQVVGSVSNTDPLSSSPLTLQLNLQAGQQYTIEVQAAPGSTFNVGAYQLEITPPETVQAPEPPSTQPAGLLNTTLASAAPLTGPGGRNGMGYTASGQLLLGDANYYRFTVSNAASQDHVLSLSVTPLPGLGSVLGIGATARVELYTASGVLLPGTIVGNENGTYTIEVQGQWQAGTTLYVKVFGAGLLNLEEYGLSVNFEANPTALQTMANTTLTSTVPGENQQLTVVRTELYHFLLSATGSQATASVQLTIENAQGQVVGTLQASAGQTVSTNIWMTAGTYSFFYSARTANGSALSPLLIRLEVLDLSSPIDPYTVNTTTSPTPPQSQQPPANSTPTTPTTTSPPVTPDYSYTTVSAPQKKTPPPTSTGTTSPYSDPTSN